MNAFIVRSVLVTSALLATVSAHGQSISRTGSRRPGIDVLQYTFRVEFPASGVPDTVRFIATATALRTDAVRNVTLDLVAGMHVDSAHVNTRDARFTRSGDSVAVSLPDGNADTLQVAVFYHGHPLDALDIRSDSALGWTAFADNFPDRARKWLAVIDHPSDKALVEWDVIAPATHRVIANGELLEESQLPASGGARMTRTRWHTLRPIYTAVMVIGVAPFAVLELGHTACGLAEVPGCVQQSVWTSPAQRAVIPGNFARAGDIVSLFSRLAGPFPYEKLAHVATSTRYGGMENAAAIFYASSLFRPGSPSEELIAHETAHQWFGDAVTVREWPHIWLSEGFATYFAALWTEHAHGDSAFQADRVSMLARVLRSPITLEKPVIDESLDDLGKVLNTNVYQKAGFVLHMLRIEIGDSAFFGGIRSYYAAHRHGNVVTSDLQQALERTAGRPLDWFFAQWMRRPGYAELQTAWRWDAARKLLVATVSQGTRFAPYRLSLAVDVTDATGVTRRVRITVPDKSSTPIAVPVTLTAAPRAVTFNADVSVMGTVVPQS
jgi:aminopeptidase N